MSSVPLRLRLVGVVVVLSALALTLSGLAATTALRGYLVEQVDNQTSATIGRLFDDQRLPGGYGYGAGTGASSDGGTGASSDGGNSDGSNSDGGNSDGNAASSRPDPLSEAYAVVIIDGAAFSSRLPKGVSAPVLPTNLAAHHAPFTVPSVDRRHRWRAQVAVRNDVTVVVALPLGGVEATMARLRMVEIVGGVVVLVLLAGVGYFVVRRSLRPLAQVEVTAEQIAAGDLSQRVPEGHPRTEVGSLSRSFNSMVAQIETAFSARSRSESQARASEERMRRFVADASHELRTPLTSIRGFAELYRQGALSTEADVARAMSRVESEAFRMGGLVDDLLLLARLDQQRPIDRAPVDLLAVVADTVQDARAAAPARDIQVQVNAETCLVDGDAGRLAQVLTNLLTNAVTHTPPSATVIVRVGTEAGEGTEAGCGVIEVVDNGPGIPDDDKTQIFERFYRADASRTRASGGSGLGLSIVAGIVQAHNGTVEVTDTPGGGATFRAQFPLAVRSSPNSTTPASTTPASDDPQPGPGLAASGGPTSRPSVPSPSTSSPAAPTLSAPSVVTSSPSAPSVVTSSPSTSSVATPSLRID